MFIRIELTTLFKILFQFMIDSPVFHKSVIVPDNTCQGDLRKLCSLSLCSSDFKNVCSYVRKYSATPVSSCDILLSFCAQNAKHPWETGLAKRALGITTKSLKMVFKLPPAWRNLIAQVDRDYLEIMCSRFRTRST